MHNSGVPIVPFSGTLLGVPQIRPPTFYNDFRVKFA